MSATCVSRVGIVRNESGVGSRGNSPIGKAARIAVELIGEIFSFVKPGDRAVIKPNLACPYPSTATTDPSVAETVAGFCVEAGARDMPRQHELERFAKTKG
jgi:uncharacterized protein (DUF362 family)